MSRAAFAGSREPRGDAGRARPRRWKTSSASSSTATIRAYGDTTHTFVNRDRYRGVFAPGFKPIDPERYSPAPSSRSASPPSTTSSATSRKGR